MFYPPCFWCVELLYTYILFAQIGRSVFLCLSTWSNGCLAFVSLCMFGLVFSQFLLMYTLTCMLCAQGCIFTYVRYFCVANSLCALTVMPCSFCVSFDWSGGHCDQIMRKKSSQEVCKCLCLCVCVYLHFKRDFCAFWFTVYFTRLRVLSNFVKTVFVDRGGGRRDLLCEKCESVLAQKGFTY